MLIVLLRLSLNVNILKVVLVMLWVVLVEVDLLRLPIHLLGLSHLFYLLNQLLRLLRFIGLAFGNHLDLPSMDYLLG